MTHWPVFLPFFSLHVIFNGLSKIVLRIPREFKRVSWPKISKMPVVSKKYIFMSGVFWTQSFSIMCLNKIVFDKFTKYLQNNVRWSGNKWILIGWEHIAALLGTRSWWIVLVNFKAICHCKRKKILSKAQYNFVNIEENAC